MAALEAPAGAIGWQAKDFTLEDAYGNAFRLSDLKGPSGTLVMFICNHCVRTCARSPTALRGTPSICRNAGSA
jgi:cytochrome oxidase Cu insertion factor (SCO1/SenC/PrrC family)